MWVFWGAMKNPHACRQKYSPSQKTHMPVDKTILRHLKTHTLVDRTIFWAHFSAQASGFCDFCCNTDYFFCTGMWVFWGAIKNPKNPHACRQKYSPGRKTHMPVDKKNPPTSENPHACRQNNLLSSVFCTGHVGFATSAVIQIIFSVQACGFFEAR